MGAHGDSIWVYRYRGTFLGTPNEGTPRIQQEDDRDIPT